MRRYRAWQARHPQPPGGFFFGRWFVPCERLPVDPLTFPVESSSRVESPLRLRAEQLRNIDVAAVVHRGRNQVGLEAENERASHSRPLGRPENNAIDDWEVGNFALDDVREHTMDRDVVEGAGHQLDGICRLPREIGRRRALQGLHRVNHDRVRRITSAPRQHPRRPNRAECLNSCNDAGGGAGEQGAPGATSRRAGRTFRPALSASPLRRMPFD